MLTLAAAALWPTATASAHTDAKAEGAEIFKTSGCLQCHGETGLGTKKGPSLRDLRKHRSEDAIHHQIAEGGGEMPAFADVLTPAQIDSLVDFLHQKKPWKDAKP